MPRMPADDGVDGSLSRMRPQMGARGPGANLGSTYNQSWDDAAWAQKKIPMSRAARKSPIKPMLGGGDPGAIMVDQGHKITMSTASRRNPEKGRVRQRGRSWMWQVPRAPKAWEHRAGQPQLSHPLTLPTASSGGKVALRSSGCGR